MRTQGFTPFHSLFTFTLQYFMRKFSQCVLYETESDYQRKSNMTVSHGSISQLFYFYIDTYLSISISKTSKVFTSNFDLVRLLSLTGGL